MPPSEASAPGSIGKNRPVWLDLVVELLARHAGLHGDGQVLGVDREHLVHARQVDADAALHREQMAFERRADAERDHRHRVLRRPAATDVGDVVGALAEHHRLGRRRVDRRFVAAVLLAHRQRRSSSARRSAPSARPASPRAPARGSMRGQQVGGQGAFMAVSWSAEARRGIVGTLARCRSDASALLAMARPWPIA